ncbi:MAG: ABC transporter substrate-binding protein [Gammaproteobacteria bacterium]|nr:ABC transporter substrate-binding protein [Gammaproteobacteria bacterium]
MKRFLIALFLLLPAYLLPSSVQGSAQDPQTPVKKTSVQGSAQDPLMLVKETSERLLAELRKDKEAIDKEPERIYALVDKIVLPHFDFKRMSRLVLAKHWKKASPEQRDRFGKEFRALLVRTYATSLKDYSDEEVEFLKTRPRKNPKKAKVRTTVKDLSIDYAMYFNKDAWKVYNITVEKVSLVMQYRSEYSEIIKKDGLDKLIARLADKTVKANKPKQPAQ